MTLFMKRTPPMAGISQESHIARGFKTWGPLSMLNIILKPLVSSACPQLENPCRGRVAALEPSEGDPDGLKGAFSQHVETEKHQCEGLILCTSWLSGKILNLNFKINLEDRVFKYI